MKVLLMPILIAYSESSPWRLMLTRKLS